MRRKQIRSDEGYGVLRGNGAYGVLWCGGDDFKKFYFFIIFFFLMIRRPPRSTLSSSSAASDVYKRQICS